MLIQRTVASRFRTRGPDAPHALTAKSLYFFGLLFNKHPPSLTNLAIHGESINLRRHFVLYRVIFPAEWRKFLRLHQNHVVSNSIVSRPIRGCYTFRFSLGSRIFNYCEMWRRGYYRNSKLTGIFEISAEQFTNRTSSVRKLSDASNVRFSESTCKHLDRECQTLDDTSTSKSGIANFRCQSWTSIRQISNDLDRPLVSVELTVPCLFLRLRKSMICPMALLDSCVPLHARKNEIDYVCECTARGRWQTFRKTA